MFFSDKDLLIHESKSKISAAVKKNDRQSTKEGQKQL